jgi:hypothetical protein
MTWVQLKREGNRGYVRMVAGPRNQLRPLRPPGINEFYKKGRQEKTPLRPEWRWFLVIQPTVVSLLWNYKKNKNRFRSDDDK